MLYNKSIVWIIEFISIEQICLQDMYKNKLAIFKKIIRLNKL